MNMIALIGSFKLAFFMMRLTIIGFGNQAKSWAQNLKDSAFPFRVALRSDSPSFESAVKLGMETVEIESKDFYGDEAYVLLTPDHTHHTFMVEHAQGFREGTIILYAHGFSLLKDRFQEHYPHLKHVLFAPKSIGSELRKQYEIKGKLGAVYSLEYVRGETKALEHWLMTLAQALGINLGPYKTTFEHETRADLFSEQGLLCSLIPYTAEKMYKRLIESGIEPELAYFECWHELKLIVAAMVDKGPEGFFDLISPNALVGSEKGQKKIMTPSFEKALLDLWSDIEQGTFNQELEDTDIEGLRKQIRSRWSASPLTAMAKKINQGL